MPIKQALRSSSLLMLSSVVDGQFVPELTLERNQSDEKYQFTRSNKKQRRTSTHPVPCFIPLPTPIKSASVSLSEGNLTAEQQAGVHVAMLDIVVDCTCTQLAKGKDRAGNARLQVLASIMSSSFKQGSATQKDEVVKCLLNTVLNSWKSRFLAEDGNGTLRALRPYEVIMTLRCVLVKSAEQKSTGVSRLGTNGSSSACKQLGRNHFCSLHDLDTLQFGAIECLKEGAYKSSKLSQLGLH